MGMIGKLLEAFRPGAKGRRTWTPDEVRALISQDKLADAAAAAELLPAKLLHRDAERICLLGEIAYHAKDDDTAVERFKQALKILPGHAPAHYGLSLVFAARNEFDDAVRHAQFALGPVRRNGRYLAQLGYCHLCLLNYQMAEAMLRRATLEMTDNKYLWNNLGIVLRLKGEASESRQCFEHALKLDEHFEAAREHLATLEAEIADGAVTLAVSMDNSHSLQVPMTGFDDPAFQVVLQHEQAGEFQKAINACERLLLDQPGDERPAVLLSRLYERVGDVESAADALNAHLSGHPDASKAAGALGLVHLRSHNFRPALPLLKQALAAHEDHLDFIVALARTYVGLDRFADACPLFERAVDMRPDDVGLMAQLASNLANMCRYQDALLITEKLTSMGMSVGLTGSIMAYLGRFDEALEEMNRGVERQPSDPGLRFQRGELHLLRENYALGWADYKFRGLFAFGVFRMLPFPVWRGEEIKGKRVIVLAEQGLGDQIMFASCLPDLLAMEPARVVLEMSHRVSKTIARSFPETTVVATDQGADIGWVKDYPDTDCFIPLADLPGHFRLKADDFPKHQGYLKADPARVAHWRARLEKAGPGPYIGLSWRGGTELTRKPIRSLDPEQVLPLAQSVKATWVCLQYGKVQPEVDRMADTDMPLQYWPEAITDLDEFAALIKALDLVITVCNTTVHYAGALNRAVWVLSPKIPEWRYGLTSKSLPWYPSSRMYRQQVAGEWTDLVAEMGRDLSTHFAKT